SRAASTSARPRWSRPVSYAVSAANSPVEIAVDGVRRDSSCPGDLRWRSVIGETRSLITRNLSNGCGGVPANQKIWRNISINYTASRHDSPLANFDSRSNKTCGGDPTTFANSNRGYLQFEIFPSKIMATCPKICALID